MSRIPRVRRLVSLHSAISPSTTKKPFAAARAVSTSGASQAKSGWLREKLWKGEAPGAEDPYTQQPDTGPQSNLPQEALEHRPRVDRTPRVLQNARLTLPPRRTEATTEQELSSIDPTYVPATTAEGLEEIAPLKTWWQQEGHWGEESAFRGFGSSARTTDKEVIEVYLRRAVVEILALKQAGLFGEWVTAKWPAGARAALDDALAVGVRVVDGKAELDGDARAVMDNLKAEPEEGEAEQVALEEAREITKTWDPSWKDIVLDEEVKFALRKRLYQLTGTLLPDARLGAAHTLRHVLTLASKPPKAKKLAEVLQQRGDLDQLANVKLHGRRQTPIDKETAVGRWKVIEEELRLRGLPVTGTDGMRKNKEKDWITGRL
ncbi:hypothetical protein S40285_04950 [Stachybotrys chlorohalonatus IBT 40285]|uniref:Large ribosomal subunit protein mL50 n=1 Tax=Stachybotrys chlorohalonatus (strain IBT 40285) TaxID=1283841 RepID=A0A084QUI2_STAC4|nr:hypothetical protein S40285_04950 [Stachybotrys chlorohalonata IBT 40285]